MSSRTVTALVAFSILSLSAPNSFAKERKKYPSNLFAASVMHFDATRQPHGWDWYATSDEGKAVLGYIATSMGVAPLYVTIAKQVIPQVRSPGEQTDYTLPVAQGYSYCASKLTVKSLNPADGDRASTVNAKATPSGVEVSTWTPNRHTSQGRSWAEGDVVVYGIKPQYLKEFVRKGVCKTPPSAGTSLISCRGKSACSKPGTNGNPSRAARSTPSLKKTA